MNITYRINAPGPHGPAPFLHMMTIPRICSVIIVKSAIGTKFRYVSTSKRLGEKIGSKVSISAKFKKMS